MEERRGYRVAQKVQDGLLGLAVGDAMGVPLEFSIRKQLQDHPVCEMLGYGSHQVPAGCWSDDTTMTICEMESFSRLGNWDYRDIFQNFLSWVTQGAFTPMGKPFGVGRTCLGAIHRFNQGTEPAACGAVRPNENGNGALMRMLPVALFAWARGLPAEETKRLCDEVSALTHAHSISKMGCRLYVDFCRGILEGMSPGEALHFIRRQDYRGYGAEAAASYQRILGGGLEHLELAEIRSGGYVVDTLEAALWVLLRSSTYAETVISAINLGQDTDTIAAVAGSLAGIFYGVESIPPDWRNTLQRRPYLEEVASQFAAALEAQS